MPPARRSVLNLWRPGAVAYVYGSEELIKLGMAQCVALWGPIVVVRG